MTSLLSSLRPLRLGGESTLLVAEVAQNHDGSLGAAHAYIDAIARAGADAVKFQTHIAAAESTPSEPWRTRFSPQDETRYAYWKRMEFTEDQWRGLSAHATERGLLFLSSPFSPEAVRLLERIGVPAWKIGAGEITNLPLIELVARTGKPVLLSSGLSSWADLDAAVDIVRNRGVAFAVLQCTTSYPCPPEKLGLNVIAQIRQRYNCPAGLSDHSGSIYAGLAAVALGAAVVEVHVTLSRECFGPDVPASVTTSELADLVRGVRFIETALANPIDKDSAAADLAELRAVFGKSIVAAGDLEPGRIIAESDITLRKPGTGLPPARFADVIGARVLRAVPAGAFFSEADLELQRKA